MKNEKKRQSVNKVERNVQFGWFLLEFFEVVDQMGYGILALFCFVFVLVAELF